MIYLAAGRNRSVLAALRLGLTIRFQLDGHMAMGDASKGAVYGAKQSSASNLRRRSGGDSVEKVHQLNFEQLVAEITYR